MKRIGCLVSTGFILAGIVGTASAIPQLINYQGYLTDDAGNPVSDGPYDLTFRIWSAETAGEQLWSEDHDTVSVMGGLFTLTLGSVSPLTLPFDADYWLGVQIENDPELPRMRLTSVGYSYRASVADDASHSVYADSAAHSAVADTALKAPHDNDWEVDTSGLYVYRIQGGVGIGTAIPQSELEVVGTAEMAGFKMPTGASDGYVLTSDVSGVGTWQPVTGGGHWVLSGNVLRPAGSYGISMRESNALHGDYDSTHVNFGVECTTGTIVVNHAFCTVSGGAYNKARRQGATVGGGTYNEASYPHTTIGGGTYNNASGIQATVGGGNQNTASDDKATVGGGNQNTASGYAALVGGGEQNTASHYATVGGGYSNTASGFWATISGGYADTAAGDYSVAGGSQVTVTDAADHTFAFGRGFTTSTPNAVIFHNSVDPIKVGIGTANPEGALDVNSTTGAFIVPRMTTAQRDALSAVNGMIIYNTSTDQFNFYENGGWVVK